MQYALEEFGIGIGIDKIKIWPISKTYKYKDIVLRYLVAADHFVDSLISRVIGNRQIFYNKLFIKSAVISLI